MPDHQICVVACNGFQRCSLLTELAKEIALRVGAHAVPECGAHFGTIVDAAQWADRQIVAQCVHAIVASHFAQRGAQ